MIGLPSNTRHPRADIDVTIPRCRQDARLKTQGGVVVATGGIERAAAAGRVFVACRVVKKRGTTDGNVEVAGVVKKGLVTYCRVFKSTNVCKERLVPDGRIERPRVVKNKRAGSNGRVREAVVFSNSAAVPTAVLESPVLRTSAPAPTPVL